MLKFSPGFLHKSTSFRRPLPPPRMMVSIFYVFGIFMFLCLLCVYFFFPLHEISNAMFFLFLFFDGVVFLDPRSLESESSHAFFFFHFHFY